MAVRIVRLGTDRAPHEGLSIGTVRRPPRGVPKSEFSSANWYDVWLPNLAPSPETIELGMSAESPREWGAFVKRYRGEMADPEKSRVLDLLAALSHEASCGLLLRETAAAVLISVRFEDARTAEREETTHGPALSNRDPRCEPEALGGGPLGHDPLLLSLLGRPVPPLPVDGGRGAAEGALRLRAVPGDAYRAPDHCAHRRERAWLHATVEGGADEEWVVEHKDPAQGWKTVIDAPDHAALLRLLEEWHRPTQRWFDRLAMELGRVVTRKLPDGTHRQYTLHWILDHVQEHEIHHRAQLNLYLRILGIIPPSI
jgi:uncharacterized protein YeaO (DUF488 family)